MQLSLSSSVSIAVAMIMLLAAPSTAACTPGTYRCQDPHEGNWYGSFVEVCDSFGNWKRSSVCGENARPCCTQQGSSAFCTC